MTDLTTAQMAIVAQCHALRAAVTATVGGSYPPPSLLQLSQRFNDQIAEVDYAGGIGAMAPSPHHNAWATLCTTILIARATTRPGPLPGRAIAEVDALQELLLAKNRKYGNSALDPVRIFSKSSPIEQIAVRLDDKIKRIRSMGGLLLVLTTRAEDGEDTAQDLVGYLVLARIAIEAQIAQAHIAAVLLGIGHQGVLPRGGTPELDAPRDPLHSAYWHEREKPQP